MSETRQAFAYELASLVFKGTELNGIFGTIDK
jgi:hypothetical protein